MIEVRKAQALEALKLEAPRQVDVASQEKEPNNDGLNTNVMPLGVWVSAIIGEPSDADMFAFATPAIHRDWISIALDNRSTTLEPRLELFNSDKVSLGTRHSTTPGAGLVYRFLGGPDEQYFVRVSNYYGKSIGGYLLRVMATTAFDAHEPNDSVLTARAIAIGKEIQAAIMDGKDRFFRIEPPAGASRIDVKVANMSTTLRPRVDLYDASKSHIGNRQNTTGGGDVAYSQVVTPGAQFYIRVGDYYGEAEGAYRLTVSFSK